MATTITYNQLERQVSNLLGLILAGDTTDLTTAEANYLAPASVTNRKEPDWPPAAVQDGLIAAMNDLAQAIASTRLHPHRVDMSTVTGSLPDGSSLPAAPLSGIPFIGRWGVVLDSSDNKQLEEADKARVEAIKRYAATIYSGKSFYFYYFEGNQVFHTRTNVYIRGCSWQSPTWGGSSLIPFSDTFESAIVNRAVMLLAPREGKYADLWQAASTVWNAAVADIQSYDAQMPPLALAVPSAN